MQWSYATKNDIGFSNPAVANGVVYVGTDNDGNIDHLYALNAATAERQWSFTAADATNYSSPTLVNGVLYVGTGGGHHVYALNAATGTKRWTFTARYTPRSYVSFGAPAVANGMVYVGSEKQQRCRRQDLGAQRRHR